MKNLVALAIAVMVALTGCDQISSFSNELSSFGSGGSETSEYYEAGMGETLTNDFFAYKVNGAYLSNNYAGKVADVGTSFLVAELTIVNVFEEEIPMWADDFQVQWGEGDQDYGYPIEKFIDEQMDDEYTMDKNERIIKTCVYEVPTPTETTEYSISYLEIYEDDSTGDVFFIYFDLEPPSGEGMV